MHCYAVALNRTLYPELLGTEMLNIPNTNAELYPITCTCVHTEDHDPILAKAFSDDILNTNRF